MAGGVSPLIFSNRQIGCRNQGANAPRSPAEQAAKSGKTLPPVAKSRLRVRIGGHFGTVTLSRLGAPEHQHVTATGDTVNAASRLLEIAKQQDSSVIVSEDLWNAASTLVRDEIAAGFPIGMDIRGRAQALRIRVLN